MSIEGYKIRIDSNIQYGQKNAQGELRFLVYYDKGRKPYQHRFIETALGSVAAGKAQTITKHLGKGKEELWEILLIWWNSMWGTPCTLFTLLSIQYRMEWRMMLGEVGGKGDGIGATVRMVI